MNLTTDIGCEIHAGFCLIIGFLVFMNKLLIWVYAIWWS